MQSSNQTKLIVIVSAVSSLFMLGVVIAGAMFPRKSRPTQIVAKDSVSERADDVKLYAPREVSDQSLMPNRVGKVSAIPPEGEPNNEKRVTLPDVPELNPISKQSAEEGSLFELDVKFANAYVDRRLYKFSVSVDAPEGMLIDEASGEVTWTPNESQGGGVHTVAVIVTDRECADRKRTASFAVDVSEVNSAPTFVDAPATLTLQGGVEWKYRLIATDNDQPMQKLRYNLVNAEEFPGISINPSTGEISWVASLIESGSHPLHVRAGDGLETTNHEIEIKVAPVGLLSSPFSSDDAIDARNRWGKYLETASTVESPSGISLVLIPAGEFMMGGEKYDWEEPVHKVRISKAFYLATTEVTRRQCKHVMGKGPWEGKGDDDSPAADINWDDAQAFCKKLSKKEDKTYRLPSEAEWEYACRAGTNTEYSFGGAEDSLPDYAWYDKNTLKVFEKFAHAVAQKKPNAFGLYDMHGNVDEWCQDKYDTEYYKNSPLRDPVNLDSGSYRVLRGGSWSNAAWSCRSATREEFNPSFRFSNNPLFRFNALDFECYVS